MSIIFPRSSVHSFTKCPRCVSWLRSTHQSQAVVGCHSGKLICLVANPFAFQNFPEPEHCQNYFESYINMFSATCGAKYRRFLLMRAIAIAQKQVYSMTDIIHSQCFQSTTSEFTFFLNQTCSVTSD